MILLVYGIIILKKSSEMGFNIIPKLLGVCPLISMAYMVISSIVCIYYGESLSAYAEYNFKIFYFVLILQLGIVAGVVVICTAISMNQITDEKVNKTMNICCTDLTISSKCNFMEKYGCESLNITMSQFDEIKYFPLVFAFLFLFISLFTLVLYILKYIKI